MAVWEQMGILAASAVGTGSNLRVSVCIHGWSPETLLQEEKGTVGLRVASETA